MSKKIISAGKLTAQPFTGAPSDESVNAMKSALSSSRGEIDFTKLGIAMNVVRTFALSQGLIVRGPTTLQGDELTGSGESNNLVSGAKYYDLVNEKELFDGLAIGKAAKAALTEVAAILLDHDMLGIETCAIRKPCNLEPLSGEEGRWPIYYTGNRIAAVVIRIGRGETKRYLVHIPVAGKWVQWEGALPFDLPLFRRGVLLNRVMVHEGPKAWRGVLDYLEQGRADRALGKTPLYRYLSSFSHVAWHGAAGGVSYTDLSPLADKDVTFWADMDQAGVDAATAMARRLALMGRLPRVISWPTELMQKHLGWDLADEIFEGFPSVADIESYAKRVESPVDARGRVLRSFLSRSAYNPQDPQVHVVSLNYGSLKPDAFKALYGRTAFEKVSTQFSPSRYVDGTTYLPGRGFGEIVDGKVNIRPPNPRDQLEPRPLSRKRYRFYRKLVFGMVANREEAKHLIRRAAWAIGRPGHTPQHMMILQGDSSLGKSVFLNLLYNVQGGERHGAQQLEGDFLKGNFNSQIADRSLVCLHEIHSNSLANKANADTIKDLIGNPTITVRKKYVAENTVPNVIHWFGSTNEKLPFTMAHGNDRVFFVQCAVPSDKMAERARYCVAVVKRSPGHLDALYAAARWLCDRMPPAVQARMVARSPRQDIHRELAERSLAPWQTNLKDLVESICGPAYDDLVDRPKGKAAKIEAAAIADAAARTPPPCFMLHSVIRTLEQSGFRVRVTEVRDFLNSIGYRSALRTMDNGVQKHAWAKVEHVDTLNNFKPKSAIHPWGKA